MVSYFLEHKITGCIYISGSIYRDIGGNVGRLIILESKQVVFVFFKNNEQINLDLTLNFHLNKYVMQSFAQNQIVKINTGEHKGQRATVTFPVEAGDKLIFCSFKIGNHEYLLELSLADIEKIKQ